MKIKNRLAFIDFRTKGDGKVVANLGSRTLEGDMALMLYEILFEEEDKKSNKVCEWGEAFSIPEINPFSKEEMQRILNKITK